MGWSSFPKLVVPIFSIVWKMVPEELVPVPKTLSVTPSHKSKSLAAFLDKIYIPSTLDET